MPYVTADDGVRLYYEEAGQGTPILFAHEFLGEYRSWEAQLRYFSRRYRCIAYNARGYPPSDVPSRLEDYSFERQRDGVAPRSPRSSPRGDQVVEGDEREPTAQVVQIGRECR